ncbi:hypothetical protein KC19_5G012000 [Ceratodon purpureus]|uniref:Cytochrome P450 n=1 Tax=Ceratodon purpureus TaxID=3225 RepID=A0A8T0HXW8_CERPU|nr:hypothetical protein KC19_5G012000 [Ceratodon purpureus]
MADQKQFIEVVSRELASFAHSSRKEIVVALVVAALVSYVLLYFWAEAHQRKRLPPGPWPWPVVGNFPAVRDMPHRALHSLAAKYGGLMYLRLGSKPCIVISSVATAKEFYKTNDASFCARPKRLSWTVWHNNEDDYKDLALTSNMPYWRRLRKFLNAELFSPARHASHRSIREEEIQYMMKILLEDCKKSDVVNLKGWLYGVTCNTMTRMITGKRFFGNSGVPESEKEKQDVERMFTSLFEIFGAEVISDFVPYLSFVTRLQGYAAKFAKVRDFSEKLTEKIFDLDSHRQRYKERKDDASYVPDLEDVLLETPLDDGRHLPDKDLLKILQEMLNAGTETSATVVEWAMAELITRPNLIKQAQNELDKVVRSKRLVQEIDLPNLPYLQAIMKEIFRLRPPVPLLLPHESNRPTEFCGYHFPTGTLLLLNSFAIHRDPIVYENPDIFDPARFLAHPEVNHLSANDFYELIPFGAGRRMCPAFNLGNTVSSLMLANLLYIFDWSLPEGQSSVDMSEMNGMSVVMKQPLCLVARPRFELDQI